MGFETGSWVDGVAVAVSLEIIFYCFCILSEIRSKVISC